MPMDISQMDIVDDSYTSTLPDLFSSFFDEQGGEGEEEEEYLEETEPTSSTEITPAPTQNAQQTHLVSLQEALKKIKPSINKTERQALHQYLSSKGQVLHTIGYYRKTSLGMLMRWIFNHCVDPIAKNSLDDPRSGHGSDRDDVCATCPPVPSAREAICPSGHHSGFNLALPIVFSENEPEYHELLNSHCQVCSQLLTKTGMVNSSIDRRAELDNLQPLEAVPEVRHLCFLIGLKLPDSMPSTVQDVLRVKRKSIQLMRRLVAEHTTFLCTEYHSDKRGAWSNEYKDLHNEALYAFYKSYRDELLPARTYLTLIPSNLLTLYNYHERLGYMLSLERSRIALRIFDLQQRVLLHHRCGPVQPGWLYDLAVVLPKHQQELLTRSVEWDRRNEAFIRLIRYMTAVLDQRRARGWGLLCETASGEPPSEEMKERTIAPWKLTKAHKNTDAWSLSTCAKYLEVERERILKNKKSHLESKNARREIGQLFNDDDGEGGEEELDIGEEDDEEEEEGDEEEEKGSKKEAKSNKQQRGKARLRKAKLQSARSRAKRGELEADGEEDGRKKNREAEGRGGDADDEEDEYNQWNSESFPRPEPEYERGPESTNRYCSLLLGGCGTHQRKFNSRNLNGWMVTTADCESWHSFKRNKYMVSSSHLHGIIARIYSHPFREEQRAAKLQQWGYCPPNLTLPESVLTEHLEVLTRTLRAPLPIATKDQSLIPHPFTTKYNQIAKHLSNQWEQRAAFWDQFVPMDIYEEGRHDKEREEEEKKPPPTTGPKKRKTTQKCLQAAKHPDQVNLTWWFHHATLPTEEQELEHQRTLLTHGVLNPIFVRWQNGRDSVAWNDVESEWLHPDFMFEFVSHWHPFTYKGVSLHPGLKFISLQTNIQMCVYSYIAPTLKQKWAPVAIHLELDDKFRGLLNTRQTYSDVLSLVLDQYSRKFPHLAADKTATLPMVGEFDLTPSLRFVLQRILALTQTLLAKDGRTQESESNRRVHEHIQRGALQHDLQKVTAQYTSVGFSANGRNGGGGGKTIATGATGASKTVKGILSKKKGVIQTSLERRQQNHTRIEAGNGGPIPFYAVEIDIPCLRHQWHNVVVTHENRAYYQRWLDWYIDEMNTLLRLKQSLASLYVYHKTYNLQVSRAQIDSKMRQNPNLQPSDVLNQVWSNTMHLPHGWFHDTDAESFFHRLLTKDERDDLHADGVFPAILKIIRDRPEFSGVILVRDFYDRGLETPKHGGSVSFQLQVGDEVRCNHKGGDAVIVTRNPCLTKQSSTAYLIQEGDGHLAKLNGNPFSDRQAGDFDGDEFGIQQPQSMTANIESCSLMSPMTDYLDVKSGAGSFGNGLYVAVGIYYLSAHDLDWSVHDLQSLLLQFDRRVDLYTRTKAYRKRPTRGSRLGQAFVIRLRQLVLKAFRSLLKQTKDASHFPNNDNTHPPPPLPPWVYTHEWTDRDLWNPIPVLMPILNRVRISSKDVLSCFWPRTFCHIAYEGGNNPTQAVRLEIKDGRLVKGPILKQDASNKHGSIPMALNYQFGPEAMTDYFEICNMFSSMRLTSSGFTNGMNEAMPTSDSKQQMTACLATNRALEAAEFAAFHKAKQAELDEARRWARLHDLDQDQRVSIQDLFAHTRSTFPFPYIKHTQLATHHTDYNLHALIRIRERHKTEEVDLVLNMTGRRTKELDAILKAEFKRRYKYYESLSQDDPPFPIGSGLIVQAARVRSKGDENKLLSLVLGPGLQLPYGKLERQTYGNRLNVYMSYLERSSLRSFANVEDCAVYGYRMAEYYTMIAKNREDGHNSKEAVIKSGGPEKSASKWMTDFYIDHAGSVVDHMGNVIQDFYASDCVNPTFARPVPCLMDVEVAIRVAGCQTFARDELFSKQVQQRSWSWVRRESLRLYAESLRRFASVPCFDSEPSPLRDSCRREFEGLLEAYSLRQEAISECVSTPNVLVDGQDQPIDLAAMIQQLKAVQKGKPQSPLSSYEAAHCAVSDLRKVLYQMDPTWQMFNEPFRPFRPGRQSLDWYILECLCSAELVDRHQLSADQIQRLCRAVYTQWVRSRIPIGEPAGIQTVQSCFSEVTQSYLDSKHGTKRVLDEVTRGAARWVHCLHGTWTNRDHVLYVDMETLDDDDDRSTFRQLTGCQPTNSHDIHPLQSVLLRDIVLFCDYQSCPPFRHQSELEPHFHLFPSTGLSDVDEERDDSWQEVSIPIPVRQPSEPDVNQPCLARPPRPPAKKKVKLSKAKVDSSSSSGDDHEEKNESMSSILSIQASHQPAPAGRKSIWRWLPGYVRMVWDLQVCEERKVEWRELLIQFRKLTTNLFYFKVKLHRPSNKLVLHCYKRVPKPENSNNRSVPVQESQQLPEPTENVLWGDSQIHSKFQTSFGESHLHVYESEPLCLQLYLQQTLQFVYYESMARHVHAVDLELPPNVWIRHPNDLSNLDLLYQSGLRLHVLKRDGGGERTKTKRRRMTLNLTHNVPKPDDACSFMYRFLQRSDVYAESAWFRQPQHAAYFFGEFAGFVCLAEQLDLCATKEAKTSTNWRHIRLMADALTFRGRLIYLGSSTSKELHDDMLTRVSYRDNFNEIESAARYSKFSNPNSSATHRHISTPYTVGTGAWQYNPKQILELQDDTDTSLRPNFVSTAAHRSIPIDLFHHYLRAISDHSVPATLDYLGGSSQAKKFYAQSRDCVFFPDDQANRQMEKFICTSN